MKKLRLVKWIGKRILVLPILAGLMSTAAIADTYSGTITQVQINDTGSMQFRVFLSTAMTNCSLNFAFIETSSNIFSTWVAGLTTAYSTGKPVSLQVTREASGFCRIYFAQY